MKFIKNVIGSRHIGAKIDITDPGYNKDVWCRMDDVEIVPGEYTCVIWVQKEKLNLDGKKLDVLNVGNVGIYLGGVVPAQKSMKEIGTIGVDSGLAGFFEKKPDYSDKEWDDFCDMIEDRRVPAWTIENGFFSESGYGDGEYPVYAHKTQDGRITALEIRFI